MASTPFNERVRKRREALRAAGLRPMQIWVPDTRKPGFAEECRRQSRFVLSPFTGSIAMTPDHSRTRQRVLPRRPSRRNSAVFHRLTIGLIVGVVVVNGCADATTHGSQPTGNRISYKDSVPRGYVRPLPTQTMPSASYDLDPSAPQIVSAGPVGTTQGYTQPDPVVLHFSGPVKAVYVYGRGAILCDGGTYGTVVGYSAGGAEIGRTILTPPIRRTAHPRSFLIT
jgi:hypothetical protein